MKGSATGIGISIIGIAALVLMLMAMLKKGPMATLFAILAAAAVIGLMGAFDALFGRRGGNSKDSGGTKHHG